MDPKRKKYKALAPAEVAKMKELYEGGEYSKRELGEMFDVSFETVKKRAQNEGWVSMKSVRRLARQPEKLAAMGDCELKSKAEEWREREAAHREELWEHSKKSMDRFWATSPTPADFDEALKCSKLMDRALGQQEEGGDPNLAILVNGPIQVAQG